jgi:hypothetical protein
MCGKGNLLYFQIRKLKNAKLNLLQKVKKEDLIPGLQRARRQVATPILPAAGRIHKVLYIIILELMIFGVLVFWCQKNSFRSGLKIGT